MKTFDCTTPPPCGDATQCQWAEGDILFLLYHEQFSSQDHSELIESGSLPLKATGHPVIVLAAAADDGGYVVTTVSSYSSARNHGRPPWEQPWQRLQGHEARDFRAFEGSPRPPDGAHPHLALEDPAMALPKQSTAWVYTRQAYRLPASVLSVFRGLPGARLGRESLARLRADMRDAVEAATGGRGPPPSSSPRVGTLDWRARGRSRSPSWCPDEKNWRGRSPNKAAPKSSWRPAPAFARAPASTPTLHKAANPWVPSCWSKALEPDLRETKILEGLSWRRTTPGSVAIHLTMH